jgi:hypothetical protein
MQIVMNGTSDHYREVGITWQFGFPGKLPHNAHLAQGTPTASLDRMQPRAPPEHLAKIALTSRRFSSNDLGAILSACRLLFEVFRTRKIFVEN